MSYMTTQEKINEALVKQLSGNSEPLSDDVIEDIGCKFADFGGDISDWVGFARAIERAHGIGESNG